MKKILFFKTSLTVCAGFPADRLIGIYKSADDVLDFYFDDVENVTSKAAMVSLTVAIDDDTTMKTYMEDLVNEINNGKTSVITIYDAANDVGVCGGSALFSAVVSTALTNV
tara:strand:+ start:332 stop:664 length:333 start_codon:yes stop_codon:yes gene_type:complete